MVQRRTKPEESGQALVILVLAIVGLLGFAALALDGGNLYTEQRRAQAAADNAVMAAAYTQMRGEDESATLSAAAMTNAQINGYVNSDALTDLTFHLPPISGPYAGNGEYMQVIITRSVPTALAHLVFGRSPIPLTVNAVAHGQPERPIMSGYALAALRPGCNGSSMIGVQGRGTTGGTRLFGGGAFVNADCDDALQMSGGEEFFTDDQPIDVVGGASGTACTSPGEPAGCNFYPAPSTGAEEIPQDIIASSPAGQLPSIADCGANRDIDTELADTSDGADTIRAGRYTDLDTNQSFTMLPGLYCLRDGMLTPGNSGMITAEGVMVYLENTAAQIEIAGQGGVNMTAPTMDSTGCTGPEDTSQPICRYLGIVIYKVVGTNECGQSQDDNDIKFTGGSTMYVEGMVYAPRSMVKYGGGAALVMVGQTLAGCVKFNGGGSIDIIYDPEATYNPPPQIRLDE